MYPLGLADDLGMYLVVGGGGQDRWIDCSTLGLLIVCSSGKLGSPDSLVFETQIDLLEKN